MRLRAKPCICRISPGAIGSTRAGPPTNHAGCDLLPTAVCRQSKENTLATRHKLATGSSLSIELSFRDHFTRRSRSSRQPLLSRSRILSASRDRIGMATSMGMSPVSCNARYRPQQTLRKLVKFPRLMVGLLGFVIELCNQLRDGETVTRCYLFQHLPEETFQSD